MTGERRLKIHERVDETFASSTYLIAHEDGALAIATGDESRVLPARSLDVVMLRYGAPFDASETVTTVAELALAGGASMRHVRHLARFDVIARDYLVYERPGEDPLCALATTIAGALDYVARASSQ